MKNAACSLKIPIKTNLLIDIDFNGALDGLRRTKGIATRPPSGDGKGWGIKFTQLSDNAQDKIIRYVFKRQRGAKAD